MVGLENECKNDSTHRFLPLVLMTKVEERRPRTNEPFGRLGTRTSRKREGDGENQRVGIDRLSSCVVATILGSWLTARSWFANGQWQKYIVPSLNRRLAAGLIDHTLIDLANLFSTTRSSLQRPT